MKILYVFLISFSISFSALAQNKTINYQVSGQIVEKISGNGVPFATVIIKNDSIKEKKGTGLRCFGTFFIESGSPSQIYFNRFLSWI